MCINPWLIHSIQCITVYVMFTKNSIKKKVLHICETFLKICISNGNIELGLHDFLRTLKKRSTALLV